MKKLGRISGKLLALLIAVVSLQAFAAAPASGGRDFNHMATGFTLSGGHASAACETCHVGGVFKGTPRNCDGCHALGKRVVATPKSTAHIVTDAPCETCHFNTSTWLGARFNHGTAQPGRCTTCHNGRLSMSKPASHGSGRKATESCDSCHRTYAWLPASWNHVGVAPGTCSTSCHNGATATGKPASHTAGSIKGQNQCDDCHSFIGWFPARYKHNSGAACSSCHNGTLAVGKHSGHIVTTEECSVCHTSTSTWSGALGAMPSNHIPFNAGVACGTCHVGGGVVRGATLHAHLTGNACTTCHLSGTSFLGNMDKKSKSHEDWSVPVSQGGKGGLGDCSQSGCHKPLGNRGTAYVNWD